MPFPVCASADPRRVRSSPVCRLAGPTLRDLEGALGGELISGERYRDHHYGVENAFLVTTGLRRFLRRAFHQREGTSIAHSPPDEPSRAPTRNPAVPEPHADLARDLSRVPRPHAGVWMRPLFVTHATRDDLLLGFLAHHQKKMSEQEGSISRADDWAGAMILSVGASSAFPDVEDTTPEDKEALPYLTQMAIDADAPVVQTELGTIDALERIKSFTPKHNIADTSRVKAAIEHYEPMIDFDQLLR